jgi:hypothetical protein
VLPGGTRCTLYGRPVTEGAIRALTPVTGDTDVAFSAAFSRVVTTLQVPLKAKQVANAERAIVAGRFGGSYARYRAALAKAHAGVGAGRGVIADELRRMAIESGFRVGNPTSADQREFYDTYADTRVRLVQTKARAPWLGNRTRGFALEGSAPQQLFSLAPGGWKTIRTMRGAYRVRALDPPLALGALPLGVARPAIVNALRGLERSDRYEAWLLVKQRQLDEQAVCRRDVQPEPGVVDLTDYLPFLAAD